MEQARISRDEAIDLFATVGALEKSVSFLKDVMCQLEQRIGNLESKIK